MPNLREIAQAAKHEILGRAPRRSVNPNHEFQGLGANEWSGIRARKGFENREISQPGENDGEMSAHSNRGRRSEAFPHVVDGASTGSQGKRPRGPDPLLVVARDEQLALAVFVQCSNIGEVGKRRHYPRLRR